MEEQSPRSYSVQSVHRAIAILKLLTQTSPLSVSEIGRLIDTPKTTCFMILQTLEEENLVTRHEDGKYRIGGGLFELVFGSEYLNALREIGAPLLQELTNLTLMTSHMAVRQDLETVYVAKADAPGYIQFNTYVGQRIPLHLTSVGKTFLMDMDDESIVKLFPDDIFQPRHPNTIMSSKQLVEQIREARRNGYTIEDEEGELGIRCVGAPVKDSRGLIIGAISITSLKERLPASEYARYGEQIKEIAGRLTRDLQVYKW